jgi:hypothetical protein
MLAAAIWQELGGEKANDAEAVHHTLGTLLSLWLLARSEYPEEVLIPLWEEFDQYEEGRKSQNSAVERRASRDSTTF